MTGEVTPEGSKREALVEGQKAGHLYSLLSIILNVKCLNFLDPGPNPKSSYYVKLS